MLYFSEKPFQKSVKNKFFHFFKSALGAAENCFCLVWYESCCARTYQIVSAFPARERSHSSLRTVTLSWSDIVKPVQIFIFDIFEYIFHGARIQQGVLEVFLKRSLPLETELCMWISKQRHVIRSFSIQSGLGGRDHSKRVENQECNSGKEWTLLPFQAASFLQKKNEEKFRKLHRGRKEQVERSEIQRSLACKRMAQRIQARRPVWWRTPNRHSPGQLRRDPRMFCRWTRADSNWLSDDPGRRPGPGRTRRRWCLTGSPGAYRVSTDHKVRLRNITRGKI